LLAAMIMCAVKNGKDRERDHVRGGDEVQVCEACAVRRPGRG
jgi:hypothetical protein